MIFSSLHKIFKNFNYLYEEPSPYYLCMFFIYDFFHDLCHGLCHIKNLKTYTSKTPLIIKQR